MAHSKNITQAASFEGLLYENNLGYLSPNVNIHATKKVVLDIDLDFEETPSSPGMPDLIRTVKVFDNHGDEHYVSLELSF